MADLHPAALGVSALTLAVLLAWPRLPGRAGRVLRKAPAALAAVAVATAVASLSGLALPRVDLPSWRSHALPELPEGPVLGILAAVLTIALVGSVQSLLSAVATDKLIASERGTDNRPPRTDLNRELWGRVRRTSSPARSAAYPSRVWPSEVWPTSSPVRSAGDRPCCTASGSCWRQACSSRSST